MKYLKKWIETNFQVSEQSEKSSGSCYYTINNTMVIRLSDHFSPIPISRIDMEIVSALNSDIFAIRYDGNLSFFLHDRQETKNIINVLTEYHFANKYKKEIDHIIQEKQKDSIIKEYSKLLTVTKTIIKKGHLCYASIIKNLSKRKWTSSSFIMSLIRKAKKL